SASRASLLTGTWAHVNGMTGLAHRGARLKDYDWHLANYLKRNGYETALAGVQHEHVHDRWQDLGYDHRLDTEPPVTRDGHLGYNELFAERAAEFLGRKHTHPFFLSCGFSLTHRTGKGPQWHNADASPVGDPRYVRPPAPLPDTPETRRDFADFAVSAGHLDRCMGTVLAALDRAGLAQSTLVIVTTDHGIAFPFMKCNLTDHGTGVMLMLRGPGGFAGGGVVDAMVNHIDVFPTVCRGAGLPVPEHVRGKALQPLASGEVSSLHEAVFSEVNWHAAVEPMRAVRTTRFRYIRRYHRHGRVVLPNCDDSPSKNEMLRYGWAERSVPAEELFDLMFDPHEACNRAADPAYASMLAEMRTRLQQWMHDTDDPLLSGTLTPWPDRTVNPVTDPSPQGPMIPALPVPVA
ncbi:MAG: sulfatase, partial [Phycisphaeraceae bacterium]|nr:sulfatase [Phycisphaeraceae bacterium]